MPEYYGWPTSGASQDSMLLKMRQAKLEGHVDWIRWTSEMKAPPPREDVAADVSAVDWCPNYGIVAEDGSIQWPAHQPSEPEACVAVDVDLGAGDAASDKIDDMPPSPGTIRLEELEGTYHVTGPEDVADFGGTLHSLADQAASMLGSPCRLSQQLGSPGRLSQLGDPPCFPDHWLPQHAPAPPSQVPSEVGAFEPGLEITAPAAPQTQDVACGESADGAGSADRLDATGLADTGVQRAEPELGHTQLGLALLNMEQVVGSFMLHEEDLRGDAEQDHAESVPVPGFLEPDEPTHAAPTWQERSNRLEELRRRMRERTGALGKRPAGHS